jgi:uncharacterized protein (DUF1778 family)
MNHRSQSDPTFLHLRTITRAEKDAIFLAAKRTGQTMERFIIDACLGAAREVGVEVVKQKPGEIPNSPGATA